MDRSDSKKGGGMKWWYRMAEEAASRPWGRLPESDA
jgi:hypothetical protein